MVSRRECLKIKPVYFYWKHLNTCIIHVYKTLCIFNVSCVSVRHAGTRACVVFLLAFNVFHSVSNCSVRMCCICCVCVTVCVMCVVQGWVEVGVMVVVVHAWSCSLLPCNLNPFGKGSGVCTSEDDQINQLDLSPLSETWILSTLGSPGVEEGGGGGGGVGERMCHGRNLQRSAGQFGFVLRERRGVFTPNMWGV